MKFLSLFWSTIMLRPYVFAFFMLFFILAVRSLGWKRAILFTAIAWATAFLAELSSIHIGFPFGLYHYIEATRGRELWIWGVPFMDSLSFTFLAYASYMVALHLIPSGRRISVLILATALFVLLDVVIDPLALRGDRWFLGKIYFYSEGGLYFGVPLSNFFGWAIVGFTILALFQAIGRRQGYRRETQRGMGGPFLYFTILFSGVGVTFAIGEPLLGTIGLGLSLALLIAFLKKHSALRNQRSASGFGLITDRSSQEG